MAEPSQSLVESAELPETVTPFWHAPWKFAVHAIVGTLIFAVIALPAIAINAIVNRLEDFHTDVVIIFGLKASEYALFGVDLVIFGVFLWRAARRTIKDL
jgi:hypothetical protein